MVGHLLRLPSGLPEGQGAGGRRRARTRPLPLLQPPQLRQGPRDENALWSLAPHDISLALAIAGERPSEVSARGESYLRPGVEDVVFGYLKFPSGLMAHLHLSWLDPHKRAC
jgi:predicted dehydrogenase